MASLLALWACLLANTGLFLITGVLTALSYLSYRRSGGQSSYRFATVGFGLVMLGGLVEPTYLFGVSDDYTLTAIQPLAAQAVECILLAAGLGLLFYAITRHDGPSPPADHDTWTDGYDANDLEYGD